MQDAAPGSAGYLPRLDILQGFIQDVLPDPGLNGVSGGHGFPKGCEGEVNLQSHSASEQLRRRWKCRKQRRGAIAPACRPAFIMMMQSDAAAISLFGQSWACRAQSAAFSTRMEPPSPGRAVLGRFCLKS